jgi:outer membrane receptor protein involved in Fe transport
MRLTSVLFLIFVFAPVVSAQSTTGTLVGTVSDPSGLPVPGVSVVAIDSATNLRREATTNDSGVYTISILNPGAYHLSFEKAPFKVAYADLELRANDTQRLDVPMAIGPLTDRVDVQSQVSPLQTDTSSISGVVGQRQVLRLPSNGRNIDSFIQLLVGASRAASNSHLSSRGGLNIDGVDEHYQSYFLDGADNVDPVIRNFSYRPSIDGVLEVRVEESGYRAELGRNGGAVVNVITKSGTNDWHVSMWEFIRNDNFDARNFFAVPGADKPPLNRNQFGGTIGGPLKRDKTFVFGWFEGLRQKTGQVRRATVPTEKMRLGDLSEINGPTIPESQIHPVARDVLRAYPLPNRTGTTLNRTEVANRIEDDNNYSVRIDHQLMAATRLTGRYSGSVTRVVDPFRSETGAPVNLSVFGQTADRFRTNIGISAVTVVAPNLVNEFRASFNRFRQPLKPLNPGTSALQPLMGFVKAFPTFNLPLWDAAGSGAEFRRASNVYNYIDNISYARGTHQYKFGADVRRYLFNGYNSPTNMFNFNNQGSAGIVDFFRGLPSTVISFDGFPGGNTRKFEFAAYVQDDWKVGPTLTVNYGLRWEFYGRMTEKRNKQSFFVAECKCMKIAGIDASEGLVKNDFNNFAPRLGFAWRPFGDRVVIRASSGIFYDNDMRHNTEVFANPPFFFTEEFNAGSSSPTFDNPFPETGSVSTLRPSTFEENFRDTYAEHWNLNVQYELAKDLLASVSYVGNHTVKGRRLRNLNQIESGSTTPPYPDFHTINLFEQAGSSNYNALQVQVDRRFSRGFGFLSSYTWGHAIDDRPGQGGGPTQDYYNMRADRGDSDFDVRHTWTVSGMLDLPFGAGKPWGGWSVNAVSTAQSGRPFTVTLFPVFTFVGARPDVVPGVDWRPVDQNPNEWINAAAFRFPASGPFGNLGRNTLRGPGLYNLDLSLVKTQRFRDAVDLQLRAEFFNVLNHPNFGLPNGVVVSSLGTIAATATPERQIQFGVKLGF